jgi:CheY-like chemotaxis protein
MGAIAPTSGINLTKANVLAADSSQHSLDVLVQVLKGFGVPTVLRTDTVLEAEKIVAGQQLDLIVIDPSVEGGRGYDFVRSLRSSGGPSAYTPVVLVTGHTTLKDVSRARDTGANFVVAKPVSPKVLLQRLLWIGQDNRPFVQVGEYIGPDRRFKFAGPPSGDGRRTGDLNSPIGDAQEPNLSQDEIENLLKPQRVVL